MPDHDDHPASQTQPSINGRKSFAAIDIIVLLICWAKGLWWSFLACASGYFAGAGQLLEPSIPLGLVNMSVGFLFLDGLLICGYWFFRIRRYRTVLASGIVFAVFAQVVQRTGVPQRQAEIFLSRFRAEIQANGGVASLQRQRLSWTNGVIKTLSAKDIPVEIARTRPERLGALTVIDAEYCELQRNCGFIQFYLNGYVWGVRFGCCPEQLYPGTTIKSIGVTNDVSVYASRAKI